MSGYFYSVILFYDYVSIEIMAVTQKTKSHVTINIKWRYAGIHCHTYAKSPNKVYSTNLVNLTLYPYNPGYPNLINILEKEHVPTVQVTRE